MTPTDIVRARVATQLADRIDDPAEVVRAYCAVQAQDYRGALWGIALRTPAATEADVERVISARAIVRTWPMRGTLHFVARDDVRWMLRLLAPRVLSRAAARYRGLGLDERVFTRARAVIERALEGGRTLTRPELFELLERSGIATAEQRGVHVVANLAMKGVLCFGAHRGKQPTLALLDEWIPTSRALDGEEALLELARRYLERHAPATVDDLAWWSGLPIGSARRAVEIAGAREHDGMLVTRPRIELAARVARAPSAVLLPPYDEYTVAYRDRSAFLDPAHAERTRNAIMSPVLVLDGRVAGVWSRATKRERVQVQVEPFAPPSATARRAIERAAERYAQFLARPLDLSIG